MEGVAPMINDHEIGRVMSVDTSQVIIELNKDLKALTKSTYEGTLEIGRINSYVVIPVGARRIVAMITRVYLTEDSELKADKTMVSLPSSRRLMKATMIGTIDEGEFKQGINLFPVLDSPVLITTKADLDAIFGVTIKEKIPNPDDPGFCIPVGRSAVFPDYDIKIDPDAFFGKHAAVIGSTGSGKSCSIATIIQSILSQDEVKQTRFIILDTNGEYRAAFQQQGEDGVWKDCNTKMKTLYIPTDPNENEKLVIPYWFMDSEDFTRLFIAAPNVQRPVLLDALTTARADSALPGWLTVRRCIMQESHKLLTVMNAERYPRNGVRTIAEGVIKYLKDGDNKDALSDLIKLYPSLSISDTEEIFKRAVEKAGAQTTEGPDYNQIGVNVKQNLELHLNKLLEVLYPFPNLEFKYSSTADYPQYFSKHKFRHKHLQYAMSQDESGAGRIRESCSTMLMRIYKLLEDSRFEFLFGPQNQEWPSVIHSLATFLRDILGAGHHPEKELTNPKDCGEGLLPFYDRHRNGAERSNVVIIDLSLLASEVIENVTALIGRLIHEFLQRISDPDSGVERGEYPVVLILEEAQNYIKEGNRTEDNIAREIFERIAREGRKYGLGLVVASQRPSELSKTVLSQCNSFIVHRLQNPEDLRYFREIVPGIHSQLLDQLPALAPKSALVLGECVQAPVLVDMREANPTPRSKNPKFYKSWVEDEKHPDFETVCEKWEGRPPSQQPASE